MSNRILTCGGVIQREKRTSAAGSGSSMPASSRDLAHAGRAMVLAGVDRAAREHPGAAHEARRGVAPHEQDLEALGAAAQHDHGRRLARLRRRAGVELLAGPGVRPRQSRVPSGPMTTDTVQKWICQSCGFIYDPAEGDPDGGIPPGTAFDDIPTDWFCPVCGARKADFEPFED